MCVLGVANYGNQLLYLHARLTEGMNSTEKCVAAIQKQCWDMRVVTSENLYCWKTGSENISMKVKASVSKISLLRSRN